MRKLFIILCVLTGLVPSALAVSWTVNGVSADYAGGRNWTITLPAGTTSATVICDPSGMSGDHTYMRYTFNNSLSLADVPGWWTVPQDQPQTYWTGGGDWEWRPPQNMTKSIAGFSGGSWRVIVEGEDYDWTQSYVLTVTVPGNLAPTATWVQNPTSAYVNQWFAVQARGDDANGNLTSVWVWKDGVPFAINGGGNGYESYSDANLASRSTAGNIYFSAQSFDGNGASSPTSYHTVTINNRAPVAAISLTPSVIIFGQSTTISTTITDADSNLYSHAILRWEGSNWRRPTGSSYPRMGWNVYAEDTTGWSSLSSATDNATGASDTQSAVYTPQAVTNTHSFKSKGFDGDNLESNTASQNLVVNKATPIGTFASRTFAPSTSAYSVVAADLNAAFANPHSSQVAAPTGTVTYTIVSTGASVAPGTNLTTGSTYTIRASYPGDSNYNATTIDATWIISNVNIDTDGDGINDHLEGQLGTNAQGPSSNTPDPTNSTALKIHKPQ